MNKTPEELVDIAKRALAVMDALAPQPPAANDEAANPIEQTSPAIEQSSSITEMSTSGHAQAAANAGASSAPVDADTSMPDVAPSNAVPIPAAVNSRIAPTGSQPRVYINSKITPHLLEGMKVLALHQPEKPLKWLSEFFAARSSEIEGE